MLDLLIAHATLPDGRRDMSVGVQGGHIAVVQAGLTAPAHEVVDAEGLLLSPPFVDAHFHMDATLTIVDGPQPQGAAPRGGEPPAWERPGAGGPGLPRVNRSGTLLEGIALWGELKPLLTAQALIERALTYCDWAVAQGLLAIRSHVDVCDDRLLAVQALLEVKRRVAPYLDLQLVAFPQDGVLRAPNALANLARALDLGVDVVGGIPHFERTSDQGATSVKLLCEEAARRGLRVDMHCDESDDPLSRHIETLAFETQRLGLQGRVVGSHCTSLHSMDNYYASKLLPLIAEAQVGVIANPLINITLQGRHDSYPKRRGMTRVPELLAAGVDVAFGHDCVMDPWYSLGQADMLEVASMGLHVAQMTGQDAMRQCYAAVTETPAKLLGLDGYGIVVGCHADFVLLHARDPIEAIRLRAARLRVWRRGKTIATAPRAESQLHLPGRPARVDFMTERKGAPP